MAEYFYSISGDFPNQQVNPSKLKDEIEESSITKTLSYINTKIPTNDDCVIVFEEALTSGEETTLDGLVAVHDGQPNPTPVDEFLDINADVTDPHTNISGTFLPMQVLMNRREIFNDNENPLYVSTLVPILGSGGHLQDHADRILNLEENHGKTGWHRREIYRGVYQKPFNLLIYYGWMNSFNSATNGWDNEKVAQDMANYGLIVLGDGIQDPGHGDYSNTIVIIPRIKELNPDIKIFGYVTANQTKSNFETKAGQWNTLGVHGIFMDECGYDYGMHRDVFNERVDFVHNQSSANLCFINAWTIDHVIGTTNDPSYPNSTYNPGLSASNLTEDDWYLLESFPINTAAYTGTGGYESRTDWLYRGEKAIEHRYNYGINLAAVGIINNDNSNGQDLFDFGFISSIMWCLEAFGTSDTYYGASSAAVTFWTRPNVKGAGRIWSEYPLVLNDVNDNQIYLRFIDFAKFVLDFSDGAQISSITIQEPASNGGNGGSGPTVKSGTVTTNPAGNGTVTFNTAFPDTNYSISLTPQDPGDSTMCMYNSKTASGFNLTTEDDGGKSEGSVTVDWIAIAHYNP
jgi:hypothetical protein